MNISDIHSIELDRSKPFNHMILFKDSNDKIIDKIKVKESAGFEQFKVVYEAWCNHPDFSPEPPTVDDLYKKRN